ncbi:MAG: DUF3460 family protein [Gallionellaceae bacterium]|nr:DUF3460 family protein [Gallionellaceae bacterium]MDD5367178.1 DUF3460 family protein [Gallionellaceae bacterium]
MKKTDFPRGEFMEFMDQFLSDHPEVVKDQQAGWEIYWHPAQLGLKVLNAPQVGPRAKPAGSR